MKNTILGWFVCILLLGSVVPLVESSENTLMNQTILSNTENTMADEWMEIQKILPSDDGEFFGSAISIDNNTALVGADFGNPDMNSRHQGAVYVIIREGYTWVIQAKLSASDGAPGDMFGSAVSLDGDTALIGAYDADDHRGTAYVFTRSNTTWSLQGQLFVPDRKSWDHYGRSVALKGDTAFIGAPGDNEWNGSVYVFTWCGFFWALQQQLTAPDSDTYTYFGSSLSLDGDTILISAEESVYVFFYTGSIWMWQGKIPSPDSNPLTHFGSSVSLNNDTALIGAYQYGLPEEITNGSAYVYIRIDDNWYEQANLTASDGAPEDTFGCNVFLDGNTAYIGALHIDQQQPGSVYVFTRNGTYWTQQQKLVASDGNKGDLFGSAIYAKGDVALIGALLNNEMGYGSGAVYEFTRGDDGLDIEITNGLGVHAVIKNRGLLNLKNIDWLIHVQGGIFHHINITTNGTINLQAGDSKKIKTDIFFGLGPINITVKAFYKTEKIQGKYLFIYSIIQ
jgi:hypothetical protein